MKKISKLITLSTLVIMCALSFVACDLSNSAGISHTLYFDSCGGTAVENIITDGKSVIKMPNDPTKERYTFDGWFWDKDIWEKPLTINSMLDAPLSSKMTVYAKWKPVNITLPQETPIKYNAPKNLLVDFSSKVLIWESEVKESFYDVSVNGIVHYGGAGSPNYAVRDLRVGQIYYIKVRIRNNDYNHIDSDWSDTLIYTPDNKQYGRQLATPQNLRTITNSAKEKVLIWDSVPNATWYTICTNGNAFVHITANEYSTWEWKRDWPNMTHNFKVKALGDGNIFSDSEWSNEIPIMC